MGAGPAGSSLAVRLAVQGLGVTIIERERFPRQKLCGEFVSPGCLPHFADLGATEQIDAVGGASIEVTRFYEPGGRYAAVSTDWIGGGPALSISRAAMDDALLSRARDVGVTVYEGANLAGMTANSTAIRVKTDNAEIEISADLFIDAAGRARPLAKLVQANPPAAAKPGFIGFKSHFNPQVSNAGRCEIYLFDGGYAGWSPIENGLANLCFMVRADTAREYSGDTGRIIDELIIKNKRAAQMLHDAEQTDKWLAVAVSGYGIGDLTPAANVFAVGDAGAFIDPFTGSGMLMALEGAETLAGVLARHRDLRSATAAYRSAFRQRFAGRLRTSALLRQAAFVPFLARFAVLTAGRSSLLSETLARLTRGTAYRKA